MTLLSLSSCISLNTTDIPCHPTLLSAHGPHFTALLSAFHDNCARRDCSHLIAVPAACLNKRKASFTQEGPILTSSLSPMLALGRGTGLTCALRRVGFLASDLALTGVGALAANLVLEGVLDLGVAASFLRSCRVLLLPTGAARPASQGSGRACQRGLHYHTYLEITHAKSFG
jgi:hypothetical protein